jgi:CBS domain containing-hemolysin-like protein
MSDLPPTTSNDEDQSRRQPPPFMRWLRNITRRNSQQEQLREAISDYIEQFEVHDQADPELAEERELLANILKLPDVTVSDIMLPRADMVAVDIKTPQSELLALLAIDQFSRIPVYKDKLDNIVGTVHIKDILACLARGEEVKLENLVRDVPIVSPGLSLLELLEMMRAERKHMVLVVDEYGGIDGLATLGDVLEAIIGQVDDEYDTEHEPQMEEHAEGVYVVDGLLLLEDFEKKTGFDLLNDAQRGHIETLGGLISTVAGRIPQSGEIILHPAGLFSFEILEADTRRVTKARLNRLPDPANDQTH